MSLGKLANFSELQCLFLNGYTNFYLGRFLQALVKIYILTVDNLCSYPFCSNQAVFVFVFVFLLFEQDMFLPISESFLYSLPLMLATSCH